jgi:hypothetical protein
MYVTRISHYIYSVQYYPQFHITAVGLGTYYLRIQGHYCTANIWHHHPRYLKAIRHLELFPRHILLFRMWVRAGLWQGDQNDTRFGVCKAQLLHIQVTWDVTLCCWVSTFQCWKTVVPVKCWELLTHWHSATFRKACICWWQPVTTGMK